VKDSEALLVLFCRLRRCPATTTAPLSGVRLAPTVVEGRFQKLGVRAEIYDGQAVMQLSQTHR